MLQARSTFAPVPLPNLDIYSFLFEPNEYNQRLSHDRKVVIDGATGKSLTYAQVRDLSSRLAAGWVDKVGLSKGDIVASFAPNQYDHIVLYLSLQAAGCTVTPGHSEFTHQISNSGAKALVTVPELLPVLSKVCAKVGIPQDRIFLFGEREVDGARPFYSLMGSRHIEYPVKGVKPKEDVAFICYSSGTTGVAKGVMLTHENFIAQTLEMLNMDPEEARDDDVALGFLPFYHIFGLTVLCLNAFYRLQPVVIMQRFDLKLMCELIQKYKITVMSIVPPVAVQLAKQPIVLEYDLNSVRLLGCGAAPLGKEHIEALAKRMPALLKQGYGMTETCSGVITQRTSTGGAPGSIGVIVPNIECKIVDENGNELGDDQEGELLVRGPSIMKGYLNNPKANAETFTTDGWMRTGDICKFDSKSQEFFIVDRLKELIKYKGFQVAPAELEALLLSRDDVADCCVVGVYDAREATEIPRAYIVLQSSAKAGDTLAKEIMDFVAKNVTGYKRLRGGVRFVDAIPKSPSGKILRRQVRAEANKEAEAPRARL
ncbi:hypothetical protein BCR43DRAFT_532511 [Syncephalastrum racemosum]|uniref:Phenylacetyl-CoA ligase n=1 Tax=Syncephalastrum racemosum TaxID=13706 RepID=A0A1X2H230_SYNRA|nr:hypothetical protein BCR43DRAFT_532511 [Syncephalastrum racemosum]